MAVTLSSFGGVGAQFFDNSGNPLTGGKIYTYAAGTTTPQTTYTTSAGSTPHSNPIILDSAGRVSAGGEIWLTSGVEYKFVLKTSAEVTIATYDNIVGINSVNADDVAYDPPYTLSVPTTVGDKLSETVSVKDFGAVGNGIADDTFAIQAALNTGKNVFLPSGTYKTTATLNVTVNSTGLYGEGISSVIQPNFTAGDIFRIGDGSNGIWNLSFSNFLVWPSVTKTSGYAFNNRFATNCKWESVYLGSLESYVSHRLYDGYYFDRFGECLILGGQIIVSETAIKTRGNADQSYGFELIVDNSVRILFAKKGIWIGGASGGIYLNRMDCSNCLNGLYIDSTLQPGVINREIFVNPGCTIDASGEWGIVFKATSVALFQATGLWIASSGQTSATSGGVLVESGNTGSFSWTGTICFNNKYDGFSISDGSHNFSGGFFRNNGNGASGGHGLNLVLPGRFLMTGATIHNNGNGSRGYGIYVAAAVNNYIIEANSFFGNGQGSVYSLNATLTQILRDNYGVVTENSGFANLPIGDTSVDVLHGLVDVPTSVLVTFASPQDPNAYVYSPPSSWTSTKFTVYYSTAATAQRDFSWRATRGQA